MIWMQTRRFYRRLSYWMGKERDLRPRLHGLIPFCSTIPLKHLVS